MTQDEQKAANAAAQAAIQKVADQMAARALMYYAAQRAISDGQYLCALEKANALVAVG